MARQILGIHHVTAIAGDPQQNVEFYVGVLGLRLVKRTVNFDDPTTYHLYYGDSQGSPGTLLTFFPWPGAPKGRRGTGQVAVASFTVPEGAHTYWLERFAERSVEFQRPFARLDEEVLPFTDPDGLSLELVAHARAVEREPWAQGAVPPEYAIRGLHSVTLWEEGYERTAALLADVLGFRLVGEHGSSSRFAVGSGGPGAIVDVRCAPDLPPGRIAVGTVHHVAWRAPDDEEQREWRKAVAALGLNVTPVIDRLYFHSIYFREPGGVLFEIATDPPGFTADEPLDNLGTALRLPSWLELHRAEIERALPALRLPGPAG